ncbi:hypothetical protein DVDV_1155 [Desulfovibrio sp. DV]|nr:hypothetical protein DVDV_1155 [Desulfovibrio sp. DV]
MKSRGAAPDPARTLSWTCQGVALDPPGGIIPPDPLDGGMVRPG